MQQKW